MATDCLILVYALKNIRFGLSALEESIKNVNIRFILSYLIKLNRLATYVLQLQDYSLSMYL